MPLHVAMVVARFQPHVGGAELQAFHLSRALATRGFTVSLLTQHLSRETPAMETLYGIHIHRLALAAAHRPWESAAFILSALRALKSLKPDVSHAHMLSSPAVACAAAKQLWGIPAIALGTGVQSIGEVGIAKRSLLRRAKISYLKKNLDVAVCTVSLMRQEFLECGFPESRIRMIPNGVDTDRFRPVDPDAKANLRCHLGYPPGAFLIVYAGRISPEKGLDVLINAWSQWRPPPEAMLAILGDGPDKRCLQTLAGSRIRWVGDVTNVESHLQAADVLILPSRGEALSNSLLEAMASGLACIATRVGGTPEVLDNGRRGLLVPPEDPDALRQALHELFHNPALREQLGRAAKKAVDECFNMKICVQSYIQLYEELTS